MFDNNTECGIHATRFIMSWVRKGGAFRKQKDYDSFEGWLRSLKVNGKNLSDKDVNHIMRLAGCGKMELEASAKKWLEER